VVVTALENQCAEWHVTLRDLFDADPGRAEPYVVRVGDLRLDYSKQLITDETLALLQELATDTDVLGLRGRHVPRREDQYHRAASRAAHRPAGPRDVVIEVDG
jgi:glucose-6-phosphate isomerase